MALVISAMVVAAVVLKGASVTTIASVLKLHNEEAGIIRHENVVAFSASFLE